MTTAMNLAVRTLPGLTGRGTRMVKSLDKKNDEIISRMPVTKKITWLEAMSAVKTSWGWLRAAPALTNALAG